MRTFLITVFWATSIGSAIQLVVIAASGWIVLSSAYTFSELTVDVFITQYVPWFLWLKTLIIGLFGQLGYWILGLPILVIATIKLVTGTFISVWAYSAAKNID